MIVLITFAFLAGIVTILSPCILPILPIILTSTLGGQAIGKARPIGVVLGFVLSFTFFTLFLSTIVQATALSADTLRLFSVFVIASFGVSLLIPQFQLILERSFSKLAGLMPQSTQRKGFGGGILIGLSLGLLWTPCVGPILASVISLALTGTVTFDAFLITLSYSLGTAIPMFLIMIGGQTALKKVPWLLTNTATIQKIFGVIMILTALAIFTNVDRTFQTFILKTFPSYGTGLTTFEDTDAIKQQLQTITQNDQTPSSGKPLFEVNKANAIVAPEIVPGGIWINLPQGKQTLSLSALKGKVVLVDFWTYSCINCIRTLPYLKDWWTKYKDQGLVIIGVHAPEFEFEKDSANLLKAVKDFGLTYPIVQDNDFSTWRAYDNHYWPAKYFIDKDGYIRHTHFGEGEYDESERVIQELLKETGAKNVDKPVVNKPYDIYSQTPETYLGYDRMANFGSQETIVKDNQATYTTKPDLPDDFFSFSGMWTAMPEYSVPAENSELTLNFSAKEVYLVMGTPGGKPATVEVLVDGKKQFFGEDNTDGKVIVTTNRLYKLVNLPSPGRHKVQLHFLNADLKVFAFTFG